MVVTANSTKYTIFWGPPAQSRRLKIKLSKIKIVATASYSVTTVLRKETVFHFPFEK